jgi:hypothetical protein
MKKSPGTLVNALVAGIIVSSVTFQAQATTLTFDDPGAIGSAETFYSSSGVTFSGGGLLADGSSGGNPGQPVFTDFGSGLLGIIGVDSKATGAVYSDSFFDLWVHFSVDVFAVSGDYLSNLTYGATITAFDGSGVILDSIALPGMLTNEFGTLGSFNFTNTTAIAKLHLISDRSNVVSYLDNLSFNPVPVPAAAWLFGSGLIGLVGVSRRRRISA